MADPEPLPPENPGAGDDVDAGEVVTADSRIEVIGGRVTTLSPDSDDVASIRILNDVEHGTLTVNPDNTMALVMTQSEFKGSMDFSYEITHSNGSTSVHGVAVSVSEGVLDGGWGTGEAHYMLETDENDKIVVEHGENHVKVYVSGSNSALSRADIAAMEGISASSIDGKWLAANPQYGQSEDTALDEEAATMLWNHVTPRGSVTSNWLLIERGYEYKELLDNPFSSGEQRLLNRDTHGESELNPLYIGAWGEGDRPIIAQRFFQHQESSSNVVIQDLHFEDGVGLLFGENIIYDNIKVTESSLILQRSEGITLRNSEVYDAIRFAPKNGTSWEAGDRKQGMYTNDIDGLLLEGLFFDHNGWADGYDPDGKGSDPMPPNQYNHNMYHDASNLDVTLRDTITMRASSYGVQVRSGGFIEDNVILDNNAGVSFYGGDYYDNGGVGNYTLAVDNVITSAAHKDADNIGALSWGINDKAELSSLVDNIIAHLADPNNPAELQWKEWTQHALQTDDPFYNDTIIYNWAAVREQFWSPDQNVEGLDTNVLDQTTIQRFTAALLGDNNATIADLADYLRAQADGKFEDVVDADLIIQFFQTGFGIAPDIRGTETTLRFVPDDLGDGVRWDNRMNWDTEDLPGVQDGDSVDLAGNHVVFGSDTTTIDTLDFGEGGALNVYGSKLTVSNGMTATNSGQHAGENGGTLNIEGAGQAWIDGSDGSDIDVNIESGRFVNTGEMSGVDLTASGGQTVLATGGAEYDLEDGDKLSVVGDAAIGFDGDDGGMAILDMHDGATLAFAAENGALGTIEEFRTGSFDDRPDVQSGIDLGNSTLEINLAGLSASNGSKLTLMSADEITGLFDDAVVGGLGSRNATIVIDYAADSVTLQLSSGNGSVSVQTVGQESDVTNGYQALWNALTDGQGVVSETATVSSNEGDEDLLLAG